MLHWIVKVLDECYCIRGDNCVQFELVSKEQVIGVMIGFYETEKDDYTACTDKMYQAYRKTLPWRYSYLRFKSMLRRVRNRARQILYAGRK